MECITLNMDAQSPVEELFEAVSRKDVSNNRLQPNFNVKSLNSGSLQCPFHYQPRSSHTAQTSIGGGGGGGVQIKSQDYFLHPENDPDLSPNGNNFFFWSGPTHVKDVRK